MQLVDSPGSLKVSLGKSCIRIKAIGLGYLSTRAFDPDRQTMSREKHKCSQIMQAIISRDAAVIGVGALPPLLIPFSLPACEPCFSRWTRASELPPPDRLAASRSQWHILQWQRVGAQDCTT